MLCGLRVVVRVGYQADRQRLRNRLESSRGYYRLALRLCPGTVLLIRAGDVLRQLLRG